MQVVAILATWMVAPVGKCVAAATVVPLPWATGCRGLVKLLDRHTRRRMSIPSNLDQALCRRGRRLRDVQRRMRCGRRRRGGRCFGEHAIHRREADDDAGQLAVTRGEPARRHGAEAHQVAQDLDDLPGDLGRIGRQNSQSHRVGGTQLDVVVQGHTVLTRPELSHHVLLADVPLARFWGQVLVLEPTTHGPAHLLQDLALDAPHGPIVQVGVAEERAGVHRGQLELELHDGPCVWHGLHGRPILRNAERPRCLPW
mmetsp:Transcript_27538/g.83030  ORF Transcript_27538/g.83030 Transcript_27538/m.83030 type:complete len:256 (+) Transcript_27538:549-1316(+)